MNRFPGMVLTEARANAYFEAGIWQRDTFVDVMEHNVRTFGDLVHRDESRTLSYRALWDEAEAFAAALVAMGVRKGDKVAIQLPTSLDYLVALFGAARIGAAAVLLQIDLGRQGVAYSLNQSGAKAMVVAESYRGQPLVQTALELKAELPQLQTVFVQGASQVHAEAIPFEQVRSAGRRLSPEDAAANRPEPLDPFVMVFTSGTTGSPKGVVQLHANYLWAARSYSKLYGTQAGEATLDVAPICHQTGMLIGVTMPVVSGGRMLLMDRFSAGRVLRWIEDERPSYLVGAPPHVVHLAQSADLKKVRTDSVRILFYAGAPVAATVLRQLQADTGWKIGGVFGWTEGFLATGTRPEDPVEKLSTTVGHAIPGTEVILVDEDGHPVQPGEPGEMWSRGPNFSAGYYGNPTAAAKQWDADGWFHSGDLFRQDEDGRYIFMGRMDDIINRGGTKIDPKSVEDACSAHPAVETVAIVGMPDKTLGQKTVACVVLKEGAAPFTLSELHRVLEQQGLAKFQWPDRLEFMDALPMTHSGKIKKVELRKRFESEVEAAR
ncbi:MAG: acyl--CoA ligase [Alicyclobacillus sp.]|nr:acyl--CoA ligase [Alicyclobacillus sp.]